MSENHRFGWHDSSHGKVQGSTVSEKSGDYTVFRTRLDAILREKNPGRLRDFLVAQGQWPENATTNVEAALWMMIATSPALADLHAEAEGWLRTHGHETEVKAIFGERKTTRAKPATRTKPGKGKRHSSL
jgi:hypothetical protein